MEELLGVWPEQGRARSRPGAHGRPQRGPRRAPAIALGESYGLVEEPSTRPSPAQSWNLGTWKSGNMEIWKSKLFRVVVPVILGVVAVAPVELQGHVASVVQAYEDRHR